MRTFAAKDAVAVFVLLALFIGGVLILTATGQGSGGDRIASRELVPDPSIYNDRGSGMRGFFEWCQRLGYRAVPWRQDWSNLPDDAAVLVCTAPLWTSDAALGAGSPNPNRVGALTSQDARGVMRWLQSGHTLLLMASQLPPSHLLEAAEPGDSTPPEPATFSDILGLGTQSALVQENRRDFAPMQPVGLTRQVFSIRLSRRAGGQRLLRAVDDFVVLFGDIPAHSAQAEPIAMEFAVGKGRVVAIADSEFASNDNLANADNAAFLAAVLSTASRPGAKVVFDEFHHTLSDQNLWGALPLPLQLALVQLVVALLVAMFVLGLRFGRPVPLVAASARTSSEYVTSLAGLYRSAQATLPALETVYRQFLRDLCARLSLPPNVSLEQLAEVAARRGRLDRQALRVLLSTCERRLDEQQVTEGELVELVRQMERFRKQLGIM